MKHVQNDCLSLSVLDFIQIYEFVFFFFRQDEGLRSQLDGYKQMYRQSLTLKNPAAEDMSCLELSTQILAVYYAITHHPEVT